MPFLNGDAFIRKIEKSFESIHKYAAHTACPPGLPGPSPPIVRNGPRATRILTQHHQFLMTLLIMALIGNVIADAIAGNPSIVNYVMFVSVFAMLSLFYLIGAAIMESFAIPIAMLVLDALNTLLFLVGGIALAAYMGVHSCSDQVRRTRRSFPPKT
ncbi:MAG: hypothetical protein Q9188_006479 [Gyalolechia gomerana]